MATISGYISELLKEEGVECLHHTTDHVKDYKGVDFWVYYKEFEAADKTGIVTKVLAVEVSPLEERISLDIKFLNFTPYDDRPRTYKSLSLAFRDGAKLIDRESGLRYTPLVSLFSMPRGCVIVKELKDAREAIEKALAYTE